MLVADSIAAPAGGLGMIECGVARETAWLVRSAAVHLWLYKPSTLVRGCQIGLCGLLCRLLHGAGNSCRLVRATERVVAGVQAVGPYLRISGIVQNAYDRYRRVASNTQ
jgi:hypothetical protein